MWIPITVLFLLAVGSAYLHAKEQKQDLLVLRHTISVNLSILNSELKELLKIADGSASAPAPEIVRAKALLSSSSNIARNTELQQYIGSKDELVTMLGNVFTAMNQSTEARRLLGAYTQRQIR